MEHSMEEQTKILQHHLFIKAIEMSNVTIINSDNKTGTIHYMSDNIEKYGINSADFINQNEQHFYKLIIPAQQNYPVIYAQLRQKALQTWRPEELKTTKAIVAGLRFSTQEQSTIAFIAKTYFTDFDKNSLPLKSLCFLENITHLLKDHHFWIRIWNAENPSNVLFYHSNSDLIFKNDILTEKEKELLRLIAENKSEAEISESLHISSNSLSRYIRMISDKLNVKNRTALVILAKLVDSKS